MVRIQKWLFILHFDPFKFILEFRNYCSNLLHIPLETNVRNMSLRESPAAKRNRVPIGEALSKFLTTANARLLEIASGCGTHTMYLSEKFPQIEFQPSDFQDDAIESIQAHLKATPRSNVQSPLKIDGKLHNTDSLSKYLYVRLS